MTLPVYLRAELPCGTIFIAEATRPRVHCAAVMTHRFEIMVPPQKCTLLAVCKETVLGAIPIGTSSPPITLDVNSVSSAVPACVKFN